MGNLKFGNNTPLALYMGVSGSTKAYYGTEVVFGGEPTPIDYSKEYLTFDILTGGTINWTEVGKSTVGAELSFSLNDGDWTALPTGSTINVSAGDKVRFKGNNPTYSNSTDFNAGCTFSGSTASFNLYGNILSLIYGDNFEGQTTISSAQTFQNMFSKTNVVDAENLVLIKGNIKQSTYLQMFRNCKSLVSAPSEIASVEQNSCYGAFSGCTALVNAPALPATTIAVNGYKFMFSGCSNLVTAPALPATKLIDNCYDNMFKGCTSLTAAPALPATKLANSCYNGMFSGCASLTTAPELPATGLSIGCYMQMFQGCTSLNYVKCLATNISALWCLNNWLSGVSSSGTFEGYSSTGYPSGASGIPEGWTFVEAT